MAGTGFTYGELHELYTAGPERERAVEFRFSSGIAGDLTLISGDEPIIGEIYVLSEGDRARRIEITGTFAPQLAVVGSEETHRARVEYQFRVV